MRVKCPYSKFLWSVRSRIRTRKTPNMDTYYVIKSIHDFPSLFLMGNGELPFIACSQLKYIQIIAMSSYE